MIRVGNHGSIEDRVRRIEQALNWAEQILAVPAAACVVIEDSVPGVKAAQAAAMRVIAITNTTPAEQLDAAGADAVVSGYAELRALLVG